MQASHLLVINSVIYSLILGLILLFYRFIFPKKKLSLFSIFILVSCLPLLSILRAGSYESGDLSLHSTAAIVFYKLLSNGEVFPVWAGDMNAGYGYPAFLFTYPLPYYITAFFHFIGLSFINSVKALLITSYFLSGIFMYFWLKKELNEKSAFVGGLFYLFAPYHLVDLHFRVDIGEIVSFVFLPLSLLAAKLFLQTKSVRWIIVEIISISLIILSHPAISMVGIPIIFLYLLVLIRKEKKKIYLLFLQILIICSAVLLTAFYWLPLLYELRFTHHALYMIRSFSFVNFTELLYSPWGFGILFQGHKGELAYLLGYPQLFIIIFSAILVFQKKIKNSNRDLFLLSVFITGISIFMMLEISRPIWNAIPFLNNFQFAYRLLGITMFSVSVLAAIWAKNFGKKWSIIIICLIVVFSTILNWGNRKNTPEITDEVLTKQLASDPSRGIGLSQAVTKWSDPVRPWAEAFPVNHIEIIKGKGDISEIYRKNNLHVYEINAKTELLVKENTIYFPGWSAIINGKPQRIDILQSSSPSGLISFNVPKGKNTVKVVFEDISVAKLGRGISAVFLILTILFFTLSRCLLINKKR